MLSSRENNEYEVVYSEDEIDKDTLPVNVNDTDDKTSEHLTRVSSPTNDNAIQEEIQQVSKEQGLSPRGYHHSSLPKKDSQANNLLFQAGLIPDCSFPDLPND